MIRALWPCPCPAAWPADGGRRGSEAQRHLAGRLGDGNRRGAWARGPAGRARHHLEPIRPSIEALPDVGYIRALSPEGVLSLDPDLILAEAAPARRGGGGAEGGGHSLCPDPRQPRRPPGSAAKITAVAAALDLPAEGEALAAEVRPG
jgi:hypothetical protein